MVAGLSCLANVDASCCSLLPTRKHWRKISLFQSQLNRHDKRKIVPKLKRGKTEPKNKKKKNKKKSAKNLDLLMPHNFSDEQNGRPLHSHCCYFQIWCGPVVTVPLIPPIRVQSNGAHHGNPVIWKTFGSTSTVQEPTTFYPEDTTGPLSLSLSLCYPSQLLLYTNYRNISTEW